MKKTPPQIVQQNLFDVEPTKPEPTEKAKDDFVFDLMDALQAPVLTFSLHWADIMPKRLLDILPMARMIALKKGESLATYAECTVYIYTRTLESPMDSEWVDIYTHVSCVTLETFFNEDHWDDVKATRELSQWLQSKLDDLRAHIYRKRREILKSRLKEEAAPEPKIPKEEQNRKSSPQPNQQQQSLF